MPTCKWRYGSRFYVMAPIATAKAITDQFAAAVTSGALTLPADEAWDTNEATTRQNFIAKFLGIVDQLKTANVARVNGNSEDNKIRVVVSDVYDFPVESAAFAFGELIGPSKDTGNALLNTSFKKVSALNEAVAQVVEDTAGSSVTTIRARVLSVLAPISR